MTVGRVRKPPYRVGPWTVNDARVVYDNPWIRITDAAVTRPDGAPGQYGTVHFKNRAVGVLAIDDEGRAPLVGQHRFPLDAYSWELPEGGGPLAEDPLAAAKRELAEETGYRAATWTPLAAFDLSNSVTDEVSVCYLATDLTAGSAAPEPEEALAIRLTPFAELYDRVRAGDIRDSLTVVMVLMAHAKALAGELPQAAADLILKSGRNFDDGGGPA
ncbi:MAG: NUDIX hydrolase [Pseudomonadota bacterium]